MILTLLRDALDEGVAGIAWLARARHSMTDNGALRIDTTRAGTRVDTFAVDTGLGGRAVWVDDTLGSAVGRSTHVPGQAGARWGAAGGLAQCVGPAGAGLTRVSLLLHGLDGRWCC